MRIIAGKAGSIPLKVPKTLTRPTTDRVRESIFSALCDQVIDSSVLDLFAGSGSLGLEALSRGAASAVFVDGAEMACTAIEQNLQKARLSNGTIQNREVRSFLTSGQGIQYDLIFADPPYARDEDTTALVKALVTSENLPRMLAENGLLILELLAGAPLPEMPLWEITREKKYGKTLVLFLKRAH